MKLYGGKHAPWQDVLAAVLDIEYGISPLPEVARAPLGKPYFPSLPRLHFNISHSKGRVLCAVSEKPVGVDIEEIRPRRDSLPKFALSPAEFEEYEKLGGDWPAFYALWTRKEAWCKYTGQGLGSLWGQTPPAEGVCYGQYSGEGWRAAVCGEEEAPKTITWLEGDEDEADTGLL